MTPRQYAIQRVIFSPLACEDYGDIAITRSKHFQLDYSLTSGETGSPNAAVSEPKQPIVFASVPQVEEIRPQRHRNLAIVGFEKAFKNAIIGKLSSITRIPSKREAEDSQYSSIRLWLPASD